MNRERAKELLPIIQAFADGEDVQSDRIGERYVWRDRDEFVGTGLHWRIKPKPREWWMDPDDHEIWDIQIDPPIDKAIKVREVLS